MTDTNLWDYSPTDEPEPPDEAITVCHIEGAYDVWGARASGGDAHMGAVEPGRKGWLGNPFSVRDHGREKALDYFTRAFDWELRNNADFCNAVMSLDGRRVACYCRDVREAEPACHLDVVNRALADGRVYTYAHHIHGIDLTPAERERMLPVKELL